MGLSSSDWLFVWVSLVLRVKPQPPCIPHAGLSEFHPQRAGDLASGRDEAKKVRVEVRFACYTRGNAPTHSDAQVVQSGYRRSQRLISGLNSLKTFIPASIRMVSDPATKIPEPVR